MKFIRHLIVLTALLISSSCSILEPASPVASYIRIDSISVTTDYPTQGSSSSRITDGWVFYDNEYLGTFPLPATIPLIGEGSHSVSVRAGIIQNGISATRAAYPKFNTYNATLDLKAGQTQTVLPEVTYGTNVTFAQIEDFDDASLSMVTNGNGNTELKITPPGDPNAFENNSAWVTLNDTDNVFEANSSSGFALPLDVPSYVELDYKSEEDFTVGVFITTSTQVQKTNLLSVRKTSTWKKIYISLSDLGGVSTDGIIYTVYIRCEKSSALTTANLYFDNLKVVY